MSASERAADRFGLPDFTLLGENARDRQRREALVHELIAEVFRTAVRHLGEADARATWKAVAAGKRGPKPGSRNDDRDAFLLAVHDYVVELGAVPPEHIVAHVAGFFVKVKHYPDGSIVQSCAAEEKRLRRLLKKRTVPANSAPATLLGSAVAAVATPLLRNSGT